MTAPIRTLLVEDVEVDALLLLRALDRGGLAVEWERVDSAEAMAAALDRPWDVVIADYALPRFGALAALALVTARRIDVPFLVVSGTVSEEVAVEVIRAGAHDFLSKDNLSRLVPAIERELREAEVRRERAAIQQQLFVASRMASTGMLAAGIAHEINNPLAALTANVDVALEELARLPRSADPALCEGLREVEETLREAAECAERVRVIVRDLRMFARPDEDRTSRVDLHRVLESSIRMARNEIRLRARLDRRYGPVPAVEANEARLGQVFLNLLINAAHACPEGATGTHEIRVTTRQGDGGEAVVEVIDTGCGMTPEVSARAFDTFFTTKSREHGTGLGLPICRQLLTAMGGSIAIESAPDRGTTVRVTLPRAPGGPTRRSSTRDLASPRRRGRVLVVDDDAAVAAAVGRILARDHEVVVTSDATDALARIDRGERFDVVLCDLAMPDLSGVDFHLRVAQRDARQAERIVFLSCGALSARGEDPVGSLPNLRLDKPFDASALRAAVQSVLGAPAAP